MEFQLGSRHLHLSLAFVLGVVLALWLFFRLGGPDLQLDQWLAAGKQEVLTNKKLLVQDAQHRAQAALGRRKLSDSLSKVLQVVKQQQEAGATLLTQARTADQFREAGQVIAKAGAVCADALTLCKTRGDSLARADSLHTDSLRAALASADTTLEQGLKAAQCRFLAILPCISRGRALEVGLVGGLLVGYLIR